MEKDWLFTMPIMKTLGEAQLFYLLVMQFCMQAIGIVMTMEAYHMIPFIRNDVVFQYFTILSQSDLSREFTKEKYLNTYIPYVIQKAFDFSDKEYSFVKEYMGNGKLIEAIVNSIEEGCIPLPNEIVKNVKVYMNCFE